MRIEGESYLAEVYSLSFSDADRLNKNYPKQPQRPFTPLPGKPNKGADGKRNAVNYQTTLSVTKEGGHKVGG